MELYLHFLIYLHEVVLKQAQGHFTSKIGQESRNILSVPLSSLSVAATFYLLLPVMPLHLMSEWHDVHLCWKLEVASLMLEKVVVHFLSTELGRKWRLMYQKKMYAASPRCAKNDDYWHSTLLGTGCNKCHSRVSLV